MVSHNERDRRRNNAVVTQASDRSTFVAYHGWAVGQVVALLVLIALIYLPALDAPFVFDSVRYIRDNSQLSERFFQVGSRWLAQTSFALDRRLYGNWVGGYHLSSLLVHLLNFVLLVCFAYQTVKLRLTRGIAYNNLALIVAPALLWALHPIQVQAVLYTVQRHETLMTMFFLAAATCFSKALQSGRGQLWLIVSSVCFAASTGCKEVAIAFPPVIGLYDFVFSPRVTNESIAGFFLTAWRRRGWFYVVILLVAIGGLSPSLGLVYNRMLNPAPTIHSSDSPNRPKVFLSASTADDSDAVTVPGVTSLRYLLSESKVIIHYIGMLFAPRGQSLDHAWTISTSALDLSLYPLLLFVLAVAALRLTLRRQAIGWMVISFLIVLAPTSSVIPIRDLFVEHRLYLPSVFLWASIWLVLVRVVKDAKTLLVIGLIFSTVYAIPAAARAQVFRSVVGVWQDAFEKNPSNPRALLGIGQGLYELGDYKQSIQYIEKALAMAQENKRVPALVSPTALRIELSKVQNNYGVILTRQKDFMAARHQLESSIENCPGNAAAHSSLGNVLVYLGQIDMAIESYQKAIELDPALSSARTNLQKVLALKASQ